MRFVLLLGMLACASRPHERPTNHADECPPLGRWNITAKSTKCEVDLTQTFGVSAGPPPGQSALPSGEPIVAWGQTDTILDDETAILVGAAHRAGESCEMQLRLEHRGPAETMTQDVSARVANGRLEGSGRYLYLVEHDCAPGSPCTCQDEVTLSGEITPN